MGLARLAGLGGGKGGQDSYTSIGTEHVGAGQVGMAGKASPGQAGQEVVGGGAGSHVAWHGLRDGGGGGGAGGRCRIAGGALDKVDGVAWLDLVRGQGILVLHDASRVDETLSLDGDVLVLLSGKLGLELANGRCLGHGDLVVLVARGLDLEGDLSLGGSGILRLVGHVACDGAYGA